MNINHATIAGRVVKQPEIKSLPSGQNVCSFSLVTNKYWKDKAGAKQESAEWHNCVVFGKTAETIAKYVVKGQVLYVEGSIQTRTWDKDGVKQYRTEILVNNFQFGEKPRGAADHGAEDQSQPAAHDGVDAPTDDINPEDIPF